MNTENVNINYDFKPIERRLKNILEDVAEIEHILSENFRHNQKYLTKHSIDVIHVRTQMMQTSIRDLRSFTGTPREANP